ncbi:MAG: hypothetical protein RL391_1505 [Actinomycetota bacterium]|jgi:hypothetical protein
MDRRPILRVIRVSSAVIFVASIAGLIISSINGNNEGWVLTIGMISAMTAVILVVSSAVASTIRHPDFSDVLAESIEERIQRLVAAGADEAEVREIARMSVKLGRGL